MKNAGIAPWLLVLALLGLPIAVGCNALPAGGGSLIDDIIDDGEGNDEPDTDPITAELFASNIGVAPGIALDAAGDLYLVNERGLFGPLEQDDEVDTLEPFGATNLANEDLFDFEPTSLVLAISDSGEFWIGTQGNATLGVVPPEGGDAEAFTDLLDHPTPEDPSNIKPETMVIVPDEFDSAVIEPTTLLLGRETAFSELSTVDVEGDRTVVNVENPLDPDSGEFINRQAHHLTFTLDGTELYSSSSQLRLGTPGIQTIDTDGTPAYVEGTEAILAHCFVVLDNGDLIIRGSWDPVDDPQVSGLLLWSAEDQEVIFSLDIPEDELDEDDELILLSDGKSMYVSLAARGEIWLLTDTRE